MDTYKDQSEPFGPLIRRLRKGQALSLQVTAANSGISASYLSRLERGHRQPPAVPVLERLAETLKVPPIILLVAAGILNTHTLREMGVPPYGVELKEWREALDRLSVDDWQEIHALIKTKLARRRPPTP